MCLQDYNQTLLDWRQYLFLNSGKPKIISEGYVSCLQLRGRGKRFEWSIRERSNFFKLENGTFGQFPSGIKIHTPLPTARKLLGLPGGGPPESGSFRAGNFHGVGEQKLKLRHYLLQGTRRWQSGDLNPELSRSQCTFCYNYLSFMHKTVVF